MRLISLLIVSAAAALASAAAPDAPAPAPIPEVLTRGVPPGDLAPRTTEVEEQAGRAASLLEAGSCKEAAGALEILCTELIRPEAALSGAVCYARVAELVESCRTGRAR